MEEVKLIVGFVIDSANQLYLKLTEFWFFSAFFGVFIIAIAVDFLISACSHFRLIPIRGYKPIIVRAGRLMQIRSKCIKPVSYVNLKYVKSPQLDKVRVGRLSKIKGSFLPKLRSVSLFKIRSGNLNKLKSFGLYKPKVSFFILRCNQIRSGISEAFLLFSFSSRRKRLNNKILNTQFRLNNSKNKRNKWLNIFNNSSGLKHKFASMRLKHFQKKVNGLTTKFLKLKNKKAGIANKKSKDKD